MRPETMGHVYELGGPHVYTFKQILEYILRIIGRKRVLMPIPFPVASFIGALKRMPAAPAADSRSG